MDRIPGRILIPGLYSSSDEDSDVDEENQEGQEEDEDTMQEVETADEVGEDGYAGDPNEIIDEFDDEVPEVEAEEQVEMVEATTQEEEEEERGGGGGDDSRSSWDYGQQDMPPSTSYYTEEVEEEECVGDEHEQIEEPRKAVIEDEEEEEQEQAPAPEYCIAINVRARAIEIITEPECVPGVYTELEKISPEQYATYGRRVRDSERDPNEDNCLWCETCTAYFKPSCLPHPLYLVHDRVVTSGKADRARSSLPGFLKIRTSRIPNAGYGVYTTVDIPVGCVFGPYEGLVKEEHCEVDKRGYAWELRLPGRSVYIDGIDSNRSNWMRFINSSRFESEQNLVAFQYNGSVYYRVFRPIDKDTELLVWYGAQYGEELGVMSIKPKQIKASVMKPASKNPFIF